MRNARERRSPHALRPTVVVACVGAACWLGACSRDWDRYDPRLGSTSSGAGGEPGTSGSSTGSGGASSSSTSSSSSSSTSSSSSSTSSSSTSSSTSSSSSSSGTTHCGGTNVLADDFDGSDPGEVWGHDESGGATAAQTGGEAVVTLPASSAQGSWGAFDTNRYYDLRGDAISVEVTSATDTTSTARAIFSIAADDGNALQIYQKHGTLHFVRQLAGAWMDVKTTSYSATDHRFWRFREDGTNTYWETSADGTSWVIAAQQATATLFPLDSVRVTLAGGTDGGEAKPGTARFDRLNGGGAPAGKWCPISAIADDFDDGMRGPTWKRSWVTAPMTAAETGGQLTFTFASSGSAYSGYGSSTSYDLTNSAIAVAVPKVGNPATIAQTYLTLIAPGDNEIEMVAESGNLVFRLYVNGNMQPIGSTLYSATQHAWWRIRGSTNTIYWETAPDGKTWTVREQLSPLPFPIDTLDVQLGSGTWMAETSPGSSAFDNLNLPPP